VNIYDEAVQSRFGANAVNNDDFSALADEAVGERTKQRDTAINSLVEGVIKNSPDRFSTSKDLSRSSGLPIDYIEDNFDEVSQREKLRKVRETLDLSPVLKRQFLDPEFAALAHDDVEELSLVENTARLIGRGLSTAPFVAAGSASGLFAEGAQIFSDFVETPFNSLFGIEGNTSGNLAKKFLTDKEISDSFAGKAFEGLSETESGVVSGLQSIGAQLPYLLGSVLTGNPSLMLAGAGVQAGGSSAGTALSAGKNSIEALSFGSTDAVIEVTAELFPALRLLGDLKIGSSLFKTLLNQAIIEVPQEQAVTILQDLNSHIVLTPDRPLSEYIDERPSAAYQTLIATLVGTGGQTSIAHGASKILGTFAQDQRQNLSSEQKLKSLDDLIASVQAAKTAQRSPDSIKTFLQEAVGVDESVLIPIEKAKTFFQENEEIILDLQSKIPDLASDIKAALETGNDIPILVSDYVAYFGQYHDQLRDDIRNDLDGLSAREIEEQDANEQLNAQADEILSASAKRQEVEESADRVRDNLVDQIIGSGRASKDVATKYASLHRSFSIVLADRLAVTPEKAYQRYGLEVRGSKTRGLNFDQSAPVLSKEFSKWFGDSKVVNEEGDPLIVYHGTSESGLGGDQFLKEKLGSVTKAKSAEAGFFFVNDRDVAAGYSRLANERPVGDLVLRSEEAELAGDFDLSNELLSQAEKLEQESDPEENIIEAYVSINNPFELDAEHQRFFDISDEIHEAISQAKEQGHDGLIIKNLIDNADQDIDQSADHIVVFEPNQIKSVNNRGNFDPNDPNILNQGVIEGDDLSQNDRAVIQLPDDITKAPHIISLLEKSDLSSFLHESGHFFFEVYRDIASQPDAPQQVIDDMQALLKNIGVETLEEWNAKSHEERREGHEIIARSFEAYLFEGKAPSAELVSLFQTFRSWLINVYKSLTSLNVQLTDEVRGVFDRMIAAEDQISELIDRPIFKRQEESGLDDGRWEEYQINERSIYLDAEDNLNARRLKDMQWLEKAPARLVKKLSNEAKAKRKAARSEASQEVSEEPVYQAIASMRQVKLHRGTLEAGWGTLDLSKFRRGGKNNMVSDEGIHPDEAATLFGFSSGDALIHAVLAAQPIKERITEISEKRLFERYGDLTSPEAIRKAASEAVHNQSRTRHLHTQYRILAERTGKPSLLGKSAKEFAITAISALKIRKLAPNQYLAEERRAGKKAFDAFAKDDIATAADQKRKQVLNNHLFREASNAENKIDSDLTHLAKFKKQGTRKNIDSDALDQIDSILNAHDISKNVSLKEIDRRTSLNDWIESQKAEGFAPIVDPSLVSNKKHYKDMTVEEFSGLVDSIKNIEHIGRMAKTLMRNKEFGDFAETVEKAKESLVANANKTVKERGTPSDMLGKLADGGRNLAAIHRKFPSIVREMDGGKDNGVLYNLLTRGMGESGDNETEANYLDSQAVIKLFEPIIGDIQKGGIPFNILAQKRLISGTNLSMTKEQILSFGLNWGNEGSRQRLLSGGLSGKISMPESHAQAILDTLTVDDLAFIQGIFDLFNSKRSRVGEMMKKLSGVVPKWVEASPIVTKNGTIPGGYYPAKYDAKLSSRSQSLEAASSLSLNMKGLFNRSAASDSFAKERAKEVHGRPILLNFSVISSHISEVNHWLSHQDWLVDANRLMSSLDSTMREHHSVELINELKFTIRDIAIGSEPAQNYWQTMVNRLRVGATIVGLGWRVTTALIQPSGLAQSWSRVGAKHMALGIAKYMANPIEAGRIASEKSKTMRFRDITMQREINEVLNIVQSGKGLSAFKASNFYMIQKMQKTVDVPTWWGAYYKAIDDLQLETAQDQKTRDHIDQRAVSIADQAVKDTQSSGLIGDLSRIQRGGPLGKLFTNFYSYFSATYNINVEAFKNADLKKPDEILAYAGQLLIINTVPALFSVALKEMLKSECDMEPECLSRKLGSEQLSFLLAMTIPTRELASGIPALFGFETYGYKGPAGLRPFADISNLETQVGQGEADRAFWRSLNKVSGAVLHYPAGQIQATVDGIIAVEKGEVKGVKTIGAILTGPPRDL